MSETGKNTKFKAEIIISILALIISTVIGAVTIYFQFLNKSTEIKLAITNIEYDRVNRKLHAKAIFINSGDTPVTIAKLFPTMSEKKSAQEIVSSSEESFIVKNGEIISKTITIEIPEFESLLIRSNEKFSRNFFFLTNIITNDGKFKDTEHHIFSIHKEYNQKSFAVDFSGESISLLKNNNKIKNELVSGKIIHNKQKYTNIRFFHLE